MGVILWSKKMKKIVYIFRFIENCTFALKNTNTNLTWNRLCSKCVARAWGDAERTSKPEEIMMLLFVVFIIITVLFYYQRILLATFHRTTTEYGDFDQVRTSHTYRVCTRSWTPHHRKVKRPVAKKLRRLIEDRKDPFSFSRRPWPLLMYVTTWIHRPDCNNCH